MPETDAGPKIESREQLVSALRTAAEVEHMLCCEYLYAGFTVRRSLADFPAGADPDRSRITIDRATPWLAQLYLIARQEMEHLGIVCNLLAAIGEEPCFARREFPQPPDRTLFGVPYALDRFGPTSLRRFVWYERPSYLTPHFPGTCEGVASWAPSSPAPGAGGIDTVEGLYEEIGRAFATLPAEEIFLGDPDRQLGTVFSHRVQMAGVGNRQEAEAAIRQILAEGEGMGMNPLTSTCHFERFTKILSEVEESLEAHPDSDPAMPSVANPLGKPHPEQFPASVIRRPETLEVMRFFNGCYHTMLVMLQTFFATYSRSGGSQAFRSSALFYGAFFPLMTMVIRPLGELLARMPAGDEFPDRTAGPSFELEEPVVTQPEEEWHRARLAGLAARAGELRDAVPDRLRPVMQGLYENLTSTRLHLEHIWEHGL